jgi:hypothetical protein
MMPVLAGDMKGWLTNSGKADKSSSHHLPMGERITGNQSIAER